jgi:hypothetical protein
VGAERVQCAPLMDTAAGQHGMKDVPCHHNTQVSVERLLRRLWEEVNADRDTKATDSELTAVVSSQGRGGTAVPDIELALNLEVATELSYAVEGRRAAAEVGVDDAAGAGKPSPRPVGRLGGEACAVWTGGGHGRAGGVAGLAGDERASVAQEGVQTRELGWAVV